jgi:hypothetical protein
MQRYRAAPVPAQPAGSPRPTRSATQKTPQRQRQLLMHFLGAPAAAAGVGMCGQRVAAAAVAPGWLCML